MISRFQETLLITFCPLSRGMPSVEKKIKKTKQNKTKTTKNKTIQKDQRTEKRKKTILQ